MSTCRAQVRHVKESYIAPFPDGHFSLITLGPKAHEQESLLEPPQELPQEPPPHELPQQPLVDAVVP